MTVYEAVGGAPTFERLVDAFYDQVEGDLVLRPMYPEDLSGPRRRLALFLMQFFGGPTTYSDERGHPALRMRHLPFKIDQTARDAWLSHMYAAIETIEVPELAKEQLRGYFSDAATFLMNQAPSEGP